MLKQHKGKIMNNEYANRMPMNPQDMEAMKKLQMQQAMAQQLMSYKPQQAKQTGRFVGGGENGAGALAAALQGFVGAQGMKQANTKMAAIKAGQGYPGGMAGFFGGTGRSGD
jgi:hypothetical protein